MQSREPPGTWTIENVHKTKFTLSDYNTNHLTHTAFYCNNMDIRNYEQLSTDCIHDSSVNACKDNIYSSVNTCKDNIDRYLIKTSYR